MLLKTQNALFDDAQDAYEKLAPNTNITIDLLADALKNKVVKAFERDLSSLSLAHYSKYFYFDCVRYYCNIKNELSAYVFARLNEVLLSKGNDYANTDRLSNFKRSSDLVCLLPSQSCLALIGTKIARCEQLLASGKTAENESLNDTVLDLCGYAFLLYCIASEAIA